MTSEMDSSYGTPLSHFRVHHLQCHMGRLSHALSGTFLHQPTSALSNLYEYALTLVAYIFTLSRARALLTFARSLLSLVSTLQLYKCRFSSEHFDEPLDSEWAAAKDAAVVECSVPDADFPSTANTSIPMGVELLEGEASATCYSVYTMQQLRQPCLHVHMLGRTLRTPTCCVAFSAMRFVTIRTGLRVASLKLKSIH